MTVRIDMHLPRAEVVRMAYQGYLPKPDVAFRRMVLLVWTTAVIWWLAFSLVSSNAVAAEGAVVAPTEGLILHYAFDEGDGGTVGDGSGQGMAGTVVGYPQWAPGISGTALAFNGAGRVEVPAEALATVDRQITVAFWSRGSLSPIVKNAVVFGADTAAGASVLKAVVPGRQSDIQWVAGRLGRKFDVLQQKAQRAHYAGQWNHWVMLKNADTSELAIYLNGQAWSKGINRELSMAGIARIAIGASPNGAMPYRGVIDDFRIYDRALSDDEINALFRASGAPLLQACGGMWINNGCFDGGSLNGWHAINASHTTVTTQSGSGAAQLGTGTSLTGSIRQTVFGLTPNTSYRLSAWVASSNEADVVLSADGFGGRAVSPTQAATPTWKEVVVEFRTGVKSTSATVECRAVPHVKNPNSNLPSTGYDSSVGYCDTISLQPGEQAVAQRSPVAANDQVLLADGDSITIPVLENDVSNDDNPLVLTGFKQAAHGTVVQFRRMGGDVLQYTAEPGFTGTDTFRYTVANRSKALATALVSVVVLPAIPVNLRVTEVGADHVSLSWNSDEHRPAFSYEVLRNGQAVGMASSADFRDNGLTSGQIYGYEVVAIDRSGNRSASSQRVMAATTGSPVIDTPAISHGRDLWMGNSCGGCHPSAKDFGPGADPVRLTDAILNNVSGMGRFSFLSAQDIADIAAYVVNAQNGGEGTEPSRIAGINRLNNEQTLRKAAILLAARLPTVDEVAASQTDQGLRASLRSLMQGARFTEFVYGVGMRQFLTAGAGYISTEDFPVLKTMSMADDASEYYRALEDARREPLELLRYLVENDRSYTEILTADYTMVNPRLASVYQADLLDVFPTGAMTEWVPAKIPFVSARTPELAAKHYPHAGVLSTYAWLSRFPTTDTNRNRHRSKMVYRQFLGFDIESQGQRPVDDSQNGHYLVPTMENPNCLLCHRNMEPLAGAFQNWGIYNQYWDRNGVDSLSSDYKSGGYYKDADNKPWFRFSDKWYRDMIEPGFEGKRMPGSWAGFGRTPYQDQLMDRTGWTVTEVSSQASASLGGVNVLDGNTATAWRTTGAYPQYITLDLGVPTAIGGVVYVPRGSSQIGDYDIQTSNDGLHWVTSATGTFPTVSYDPRPIPFSRAVSARYVRVNVRSAIDAKTYIQIGELYTLKPVEAMPVPYAENGNGSDDALQWVAQEITRDRRFAKGAASFWYGGLFGRPPLQAPTNSAGAGFAGDLAAFQVQDRVFEETADAFIASGYKVRDLLVELIMSDLFRAAHAVESLDDARAAELVQIGQGRLLTVEELNAKGMATIGRKYFDSSTSGLGLLYSGFDGGQQQLKGNTNMTTIMLAAAESRIKTRLCDNQVEKTDLQLPADQRSLFPLVKGTESPAPFTGDAPAGARLEWSTWIGLTGSALTNLENSSRYGGAADTVSYPAAIDSAVNAADNYGDRYRGYLVPPADGPYTFWVAGDDQVSLRISATPDQADLREIAFVSGWTGVRQWNKYPEQQSAALVLQGGKRYLLEVVHKEGTGGDHVSVSWSGPGFEQRIVSANDFAELATIPVEVRNATQTIIKRNLQHLHARLLGETLQPGDPELERSFQLYREVYFNTAPETSGMEVYCETRNGSGPGARAWNAVLAYLLADFRYINQ